MQDSFYTNVAVRGDNILYRGYKDGKRVQHKVPYQPTVYLLTQKTPTGKP